jgi:hypothetical protein
LKGERRGTAPVARRGRRASRIAAQYLRWLDKHERAPGEEAPIGFILGASADAEQVELLQLDAKSIRVSEYLTALPPLPLLRRRLHQAIEHAREAAARGLPASDEEEVEQARVRREQSPLA